MLGLPFAAMIVEVLWLAHLLHREVLATAAGMVSAGLEDHAAVHPAATVGAENLHQQRLHARRNSTRRRRGDPGGAARVRRSISRLRPARIGTHRKQVPTSGCS